MTWVWSRSRSKPTQRLVLLAIADCANDRGAEAYPSTATLMQKTGLSERGVRKAVAELEELGELSVDYKGGPHGCNRYRLIMDPAPRAESPADDHTRHVVPGPQQTRHDMPGTRHDMHPAPHAADPARGAADPAPHAENPAPRAPKPSEPSENRQEPSKVDPAPPAQPPDPPRPDVDQVCRYLADRIEANGSKRPRITARWRQAARLMIDTDGRTADQILRAIDWCQNDEFWRANILSMPKLRERYDQLRLAAQRTAARTAPSDQPRSSTTDQRVAAALAAGASLQAQLDQHQRLEIAS
jgi:hypothetical protein